MNQYRLGPNKILIGGLVQPVFDGFKLFLKIILNTKKNNIIFFFRPIITFFIRILFWNFFINISLKIKIFFVIFLLGVGIYSFVLRGWRRFSKFGYLGGIRASSQTVSYEISLAIIFIRIIFNFKNFQFFFWGEIFIIFVLFFLIFIWFISLLAETNRAPFDFSEGERELISGFNIEYGRSGFILFFLAEYSIIIFFSLIRIFIFSLNISFFFLFLFFFISMRTSFPRFRYDFLIKIIWFKILPFVCFNIFILNLF